MSLNRVWIALLTFGWTGQVHAEQLAVCHAQQNRLAPSVQFENDWMQSFIVGGKASRQPGVIGLKSVNGGAGSCTSSLIGKNAILTSVHCVCDLSAEAIKYHQDKDLLELSYYDPKGLARVSRSRILQVFPENADKGTRCGSKNLTSERVATDFAVVCIPELPHATQEISLGVAEKNFEGDVYGTGGNQVHYRAQDVELVGGKKIPGFVADYSKIYKNDQPTMEQKKLTQEFETIDVGTPQVRMIARNSTPYSLGDVDAKIEKYGNIFPVDVPASIYPGDSGGPVLSEGKQVGISTQISLPTFKRNSDNQYEAVVEQVFLAITPWLKNRMETYASQCSDVARLAGKTPKKTGEISPFGPAPRDPSPNGTLDWRSLMRPPGQRK